MSTARSYTERCIQLLRHSDVAVRENENVAAMSLWYNFLHFAALVSGLTKHDIGRIEDVARSLMGCHGHPGLMIAAASKGSIELNLALGYRDVTKQSAMSTDTLINIGAMTTAFTGLKKKRDMCCNNGLSIHLCCKCKGIRQKSDHGKCIKSIWNEKYKLHSKYQLYFNINNSQSVI